MFRNECIGVIDAVEERRHRGKRGVLCGRKRARKGSDAGFRRATKTLHVHGQMPMRRAGDCQSKGRLFGEPADIPVGPATPIGAEVERVHQTDVGCRRQGDFDDLPRPLLAQIEMKKTHGLPLWPLPQARTR